MPHETHEESAKSLREAGASFPTDLRNSTTIFDPEKSALYQASLADQGDEAAGLTDQKRMLSVMNIELHAGDLPLDRQLTLLRAMRQFAEVVSGRHYIHGWTDGKK